MLTEWLDEVERQKNMIQIWTFIFYNTEVRTDVRDIAGFSMWQLGQQVLRYFKASGQVLIQQKEAMRVKQEADTCSWLKGYFIKSN